MLHTPISQLFNSTSPRRRAALLGLFTAAALVACGGGSGSGPTQPGSTATYTVSATVSGLSGSGLVLQDNAGDDKTVSANGSFEFATSLASGAAYQVSVKTQPDSPAQTCIVANGSGTVAAADVSNVSVTCVNAAAYTVGGTVSGLAGTGLVLQDNAGDDTSVAANGSFTFATKLASGAAYAVSVKTQPSSPAQTCTVANGSGTVGVASIGNVAVTCVAADTDTRPLSLAFAPATNAAMGVVFPYSVSEKQGIALTSVTWYFDGAVGGHTLTGYSNATLQVWNTPGAHTIRVVVTASNGRSAEASASISAIGAPLASGDSHSCAMMPGGAVKCWGYGGYGNMGNGSTSAQPKPVDVTGLSGVLGLASGGNHSCALKADQTVVCWGDNGEGQLGNAATNNHQSNVPATVDGLSGVVALAAGRYHTCALKTDGSVLCFGDNTAKQLGTASSASDSVTPVVVAGLSNIVAISAGHGDSSCALKADTTVVCWGDNTAGALGIGATSYSATGTPQTVLTAAGTALNRVLALRSGTDHSCAIVDDGSYSTYCWGNNNYNQITAGAGGIRLATLVSNLSGNLMLATTNFSSCSFTVQSSFQCWGSNYYGEADGKGVAGTYVTSPTAVTGLQSGALPEYASGGNEFLCALQSDGTAKCVGRGGSGQLGNGLSTDTYSVQPVSVNSGTFWTWTGIVNQ